MKEKTIGFQITNNCLLNCKYCYQKDKHNNKTMSLETAKLCVDQLFLMNDIDKFSFGFIGGEPLMAVDVIDYICSYFMDKCIEENKINWYNNFTFNLTTNGSTYFTKEVQKFLKKYKDKLELFISLDGPEEIHNACRYYLNGKGNYKEAYSAIQHYIKNFNSNLPMRCTISKDNLKYLDIMADYFIKEKFNNIYINLVYDNEWNINDAKLLYTKMKNIADQLLKYNNIKISLFEEWIGQPIPPYELENCCGGCGQMLIFDPDGFSYPCIRFMSSSLGDKQKPIILGDKYGLINIEKIQELNTYNRKTMSTKECFNCSVARGCGYCPAYQYELYGTPNKRCMNICLMHKAKVLANAYYWNKKNIKFKLNLSKEEALQFISEEEYQEIMECSIN